MTGMTPPRNLALTGLVAALTALAALGAAARDHADGQRASAWSGPAMGQSRVFVGSILPRPDGIVIGGLEMRMDEGWFTYWRTPGEAGAPPAIDWSRSENVREIRMFWPAPTRKIVDGHAVNGYPDEVLFPLVIVPEEPGVPIDLRLTVSFALCGAMCVPAVSEHDLRIEPLRPFMGGAMTGGDLDWTAGVDAWVDAVESIAGAYADSAEDFAARLEEALERVPDREAMAALTEQTRAHIRETLAGRALTIEMRLPEALRNPQVFVEGPRSVVFGHVKTELAEDGHRIIIVAPITRGGATPLDGKNVVVTVVDDAHAFEERLSVSRRTVVRLPWPQAGQSSLQIPGPPTPPPTPRPE